MAGALDGSSKGNGMLAVMVFALIFGIALTQIPPERRVSLTGVLEGLFDVSMVIIGFAMWLAPFGIACLMFAMTSRLGGDILYTLVWFVGTVLLGIGIQMFVVYSILIWFFTKRSPLEFFRATQEALLTAFGTSSSNATLPTSLKLPKRNLVYPRDLAVCITIGSTANQNGTALMKGSSCCSSRKCSMLN